MLAKDRPEIVERALRSALPLVSAWLVSVEPGDPLGAHIAEFMASHGVAGVAGEVVEFERENGGAARTLLMQHGRRVAAAHGCDWLLNLDADDEYRVPDGWTWPELEADVYELNHAAADSRFLFRRLFRAALPWRWEGVIHEVPALDQPHSIDRLEGPVYVRHVDGDREPDRYQRHARLMAAQVIANPDDTRAAFYLAQSLRDAGDIRGAFDAYGRRALMPGGWREEIYESLYQRAQLAEVLQRPWHEAMELYLIAWAFSPWRAEPLYMIGAHYAAAKVARLAYHFATQAAALPLPQDGVNVALDVYAWRSNVLLGTVAYWVGEFEIGERAARAALEGAIGFGVTDEETLTAVRETVGAYDRRKAAPPEAESVTVNAVAA